MLRTYYYLTKPGIIYGNLINTAAGFLLAAKARPEIGLLLATLAGTALVIASACVFNNYIDRDIDAKMTRTKKRALVSGLVSAKQAIIYAILLGTLGFGLLIAFTNALTVSLGLVAIFTYVVLYGITKRRSVHGTVVGSIAGALPPVAGYTAVSNRLDTGAVLLFLVLVFWQMPHFYAIAIRRLNEYKAAGLPVLPVKKGLRQTKVQMLLYIVAFIITSSLFTLLDYTGVTFLVVMVGLGLVWLRKGVKGWQAKNDTVWARDMFLFSLKVILALAVMLSLGSVLI